MPWQALIVSIRVVGSAPAVWRNQLGVRLLRLVILSCYYDGASFTVLRSCSVEPLDVLIVLILMQSYFLMSPLNTILLRLHA